MSEEKQGVQGIQEIKDLLVAVNELSLLLIKHLKDGISLSDGAAVLASIMASEELKSKVVEAYVGVSKIPAELGDLSVAEGIELAMVQAQFVPQILAALK